PPLIAGLAPTTLPRRTGRLSLGLYLVVLPGARGWLAVAAHHIHHPQEQGVAAQPAQPQSHRGKGARSHPLPLPPPPLSMAAAAPAARNSPGSARLPSGARTHARGGTRGAAAAGPGRTASLRHAGAWRAPAPSLSLANRRAGGAAARAAPRGAAFKPERGRPAAAAARPYPRTPPPSRLRPPAGSAASSPHPAASAGRGPSWN
uniref:Uncharacterized protein n=1 Tax=Otus sunia TaxID=257818 RepID=A0A8C8BHE1_9STRI